MIDADSIIKDLLAVTGKWAKQRKAEERHTNAIYNRRSVMTRSSRVTIRKVAWEVMEQAYLKVSGNGKRPAHARQIMYAARPTILAKATKQKFNDEYFIQVLLPQYMADYPQKTAKWNVVFDARDHLIEPHTDERIDLGTLGVRRYVRDINLGLHEVPAVEDKQLDTDYPTMGPTHRYGAILFIEKEGFDEHFREAKLAERYDIAIMSTKGMSNMASRELVDNLCGGGVPLPVLHDFDKAGFSILETLRKDTQRYTFNNEVNVIDLGLRLEDVKKWKLQAEPVSYKSDPRPNLRENGATDEEVAFLCSGGDQWRGYSGQRVELNAFTSEDLLEWIEGKLEEHGIKKVVPDAVTLEIAYRRAAVIHIVNERIVDIVKDAHKEVDARRVSRSRIAEEVRDRLEESPALSWDQAIADLAAEDEKKKADDGKSDSKLNRRDQEPGVFTKRPAKRKKLGRSRRRKQA